MNNEPESTIAELNTENASLPERDIDILVVKLPSTNGQILTSGDMTTAGSLIVLENGQSVEYVPVWQTGQVRHHDLMVGIVTRRMPQLGGVFVDVGTVHDGLLRIKADAPLPPEGSRVVVSVLREAQAGKGPVLTRSISIPSRFAVLRTGQNPLRRSILKMFDPVEADRLFNEDLSQLTLRHAELMSASQSGPAPRCLLAAGDPLLVLTKAWPLRIRSIQVEGAERYQRVEQLLIESAPDLLPFLKLHPEHRTYDLAAVHRQGGLAAAVHSRLVRLDSGATIFIDRTEALYVIDVNSGAASARDKADLADRVNREAIREIARQIRLRNLTGMIVIDLIHQKDKAVQAPYVELLRQSLSGDRGKSTLYGFSALSLLEMIRTAP